MAEPIPSPLEAALEEMPLFPLTQVVLFPHAFLPLHVFEHRYRALVADCLKSHKVFAVALVTDVVTGVGTRTRFSPPLLSLCSARFSAPANVKVSTVVPPLSTVAIVFPSDDPSDSVRSAPT